MMPDNAICILLTGTIEPKGVPNLKRVDPLERERDYCKSIEKWTKSGYSIVFVENSNYDSNELQRIFADNLNCEYLKFSSQVSILGKSNGEAEIISYAFQNSSALKEAKTVIKVSGRQYVKNYIDIVDDFIRKDLYTIGWFKYGMHFADSRFLVAKKDFYLKYLIVEFSRISERNHIYFEHVLASAIHRSIADGHSWSFPNRAPICEGVSGTGNIVYKNGLLKVVKGNMIVKITQWLLNLEY